MHYIYENNKKPFLELQTIQVQDNNKKKVNTDRSIGSC